MHVQLHLFLKYCLLYMVLHISDGNDAKHNTFSSVDCWCLWKQLVPVEIVSFILANVQNVLQYIILCLTCCIIWLVCAWQLLHNVVQAQLILSCSVHVCLSVTFMNSVKTSTCVFQKISLSGCQTILVPHSMAILRQVHPNSVVKCRWGRLKSGFSLNIWLHYR